jgi:hypothetical protein
MLALGLLWSKTRTKTLLGASLMWLEKLSYGLLRVLTPLGPRYLKPSLLQRFYLLWLFRNFPTLPVKVLTARQQRRIENMCAEKGFIPLPLDLVDPPVLGTLEQRPTIGAEGVPPRRPSRSVPEPVTPFAADQRRS